PPVTGKVVAEKSEEFVFDTPLYIATISNVGGVLKSYKLKAYSDGEGHPLELINEMAGQQIGWPMTLVTGDKAIDDELQKAQFVGVVDGDTLRLQFAANGLQVKKTFHFSRDVYEFSLGTALSKDGVNHPYSVVWQGAFGDQSIPQDPAKKNAVYQ